MNFHAVKCKYLVFVSSKQLLQFFMLCAVVINTTFLCSRLCEKIQRAWKHLSDNGLLQKAMGFLRFTVCMNSHSLLKNNDKYSYTFCPNIGVKDHVIPHSGKVCRGLMKNLQTVQIDFFKICLLYEGVSKSFEPQAFSPFR